MWGDCGGGRLVTLCMGGFWSYISGYYMNNRPFLSPTWISLNNHYLDNCVNCSGEMRLGMSTRKVKPPLLSLYYIMVQKSSQTVKFESVNNRILPLLASFWDIVFQKWFKNYLLNYFNIKWLMRDRNLKNGAIWLATTRAKSLTGMISRVPDRS